MSSVLPAPAAAGLTPGERPRAQFGGLHRRHVILILCFGLITPPVEALFALTFGDPVHAVPMLGEVAKYLAISFTTVSLALVLDRRLRVRLGSLGSLAIAFLAASVMSMALIELINFALVTPLGWDVGYKMESKGIGPMQRVLWETVEAARWSLVLVALYELLESNHRAGEELHAARMTALAAQKNLVEGELRAMQARVDPELLFNSLVAIDEGYARGVEAGQQRLDGLIRFLRAALPSDSGGTSTVAREQELVEAYVALLNQRAGDTAHLEVSVDSGAEGEQMPSMLLLPLTRWALAQKSARNLRVRIGRRGDMLALEVESDARKDDIPSSDEIASVRGRIDQLYPGAAQLSIEAWRARLEIPRQAPAPSPA